jgi:hypothetical protein
MKKTTFTILTFLILAIIYVGCCTAMSSCSYEMRKGTGCKGATGISAARASYKGR